MRNAEGIGVEQLQLYIAIDAKKVIIITATHLPGRDFAKYEAAFLKMMESVQDANGSQLIEAGCKSLPHQEYSAVAPRFAST